ncbi:hypothetical protein PTTG_06400 [Puccinia triticina 1-1 BBBD Race 1]|uniref:CRAL-TRIO domain-containing protein n=2 Tax=Puccinia triticina TaxID=208348 RepID=A0A0C4DF74_PUCT1|nr:uncharacterized protein PtA15_18A23 [Puccinia triticina]OAV92465.1 hypothetical protein PTTG_06400 [Puccinia triticina 1-1 BBBD Race 1]WAQ92968.1 hypothetical protein PtA15_18A23 [Puccinia triticina]WAR62948.1 hypothetical protein PtB15_18B30 [Puccinia triticina]
MSNQPSTELEFFPHLTESQLTDLKKFWEALNGLLYTPAQANQADGKATKTKAEPTVPERVKNLVGESEAERLATELWAWIMMDDPDMMVLKYIRAKKFKSTADSLELLINSLKFRADRKLSTIYYENPSILKQLKTAKAFVFGFDKSGSPIFRVNAAKHKTSDQTPRELEDFILYSMEVTRLFVVPPAETVTMLIDLSGFGMSNMDWKCASFMISTLESYYPETLNHQIIHNAPWIFQGIWKAISTMIDPVVRSKVLFTSKNEDLIKLVDKRNLFKAEGGESSFEWTIPANYPVGTSVPPANTDPAEVEKAKQAERRVHLDLTPEQERAKISELNVRATLVARFISLTQLWLSASEDQTSAPERLVKILALRQLLKLILRAQYLKMTPLIVPNTIYHYRGILKGEEPGTIDFEAEGASSRTNGGQDAQAGQPAIMGQEYARPSLLKTIEHETSRFRSTYPPSSSSLPDATTDPSPAHENPEQVDPIDQIFTEITRLEF